jgi:AraC-like DNA-binding protein
MNSRLNRIEDWEKLAAANHFSSSSMARGCGITVRQLERFFLATQGMSPHKWLREKRMQQAVKLLLLNYTVKETWLKLGYKDAAHFTHDFQEYFGTTPSSWCPQGNAKDTSGLNVAFQQEMSRFNK